MTTSVLAAAPVYARRPVSWRRLGWVSWRRYRTSLVAAVALLAVVALYLVIRGLQIRSAYASVLACTPRSAPNCQFALDNFQNHYGDIGLAGALLVWVPAVIGAFAGAPLLAREFETGTFRFAWTQGVGRLRWLVSLLVPGALGVAVLSAALGGLVRWYEQPLLQSGVHRRLDTSVFPLTGLAVVGWGLLAFALGVLAGLVARRAVPALVATLAVWTGLAFLTAVVLRDRYLTPLNTRLEQLQASDRGLQQWWSSSGHRVSDAEVNQVLQAIGVQANGGGFQAHVGSAPKDPIQYLAEHGYTAWTSYQPDHRYWTFQWIEFGWLAVLSLALLGTTLWLVRRRAA
jgi:hypothetical protein